MWAVLNAGARALALIIHEHVVPPAQRPRENVRLARSWRDCGMVGSTLFDLGGTVALVTGGNGGIGRGIALGLASAGADVVIAARDERKTHAVVAELAALG